MRRNNWTYAGLVLLGVVALLFFLNSRFPGALNDQGAQMQLVYGLCWLALVIGSVAVGWRGQANIALKQALAWVATALVLVIIYSYRGDLLGVGHGLGERVMAELAPSVPRQAAPGAVYLTRNEAGHFHVNALVNGTVVDFLVDTGASDVAISADDARRLGFDLDKLAYTTPYETANGTTFAARVTIDDIRIGDIDVRDVPASISRGNGMSLLGMTFLSRLGSIEVKGDRLVLRQ